MDVAVLGMGRMGRALAARLLEGGHRVAVWNRSPGRAGDVVSAGARETRSVADAVDGVDVALAESFAVGRSGGLSDDQLRELLGANPMVAGLTNRFEGVLTGSREGWWTTMLGAKDAGLAVEIARGAGLELPLTQVVQRLYDKAAASGLDDADIAAVTELYRGPAPPAGTRRDEP